MSYPTLPAALAAAHGRILPCGIAVAGSGQVDKFGNRKLTPVAGAWI